MIALFFSCVRALSSEFSGSQDMNASMLSGVGVAGMMRMRASEYRTAAEEQLGPNRRLKMRRKNEVPIRRASDGMMDGWRDGWRDGWMYGWMCCVTSSLLRAAAKAL